MGQSLSATSSFTSCQFFFSCGPGQGYQWVWFGLCCSLKYQVSCWWSEVMVVWKGWFSRFFLETPRPLGNLEATRGSQSPCFGWGGGWPLKPLSDISLSFLIVSFRPLIHIFNRLNEVYSTYPIHSFKVYNSISCSIFRVVQPLLESIFEHFIAPKENPHSLIVTFYPWSFNYKHLYTNVFFVYV